MPLQAWVMILVEVAPSGESGPHLQKLGVAHPAQKHATGAGAVKGRFGDIRNLPASVT